MADGATPVAAGVVEILICTTCRPPGADPAAPRPGAALAQAVAGALPEGVRLTAVECLSNCSRACTIALRGPGRWTYVYGDIEPARDLAAVLDGTAKFRAAPDGLVPWRERPEHFRKHCIARIPPLER